MREYPGSIVLDLSFVGDFDRTGRGIKDWVLFNLLNFCRDDCHCFSLIVFDWPCWVIGERVLADFKRFFTGVGEWVFLGDFDWLCPEGGEWAFLDDFDWFCGAVGDSKFLIVCESLCWVLSSWALLINFNRLCPEDSAWFLLFDLERTCSVGDEWFLVDFARLRRWFGESFFFDDLDFGVWGCKFFEDFDWNWLGLLDRNLFEAFDIRELLEYWVWSCDVSNID